jgi:hypothetical protein
MSCAPGEPCEEGVKRRRALIELAAQHSLPIVEDDPYGELRYSGEAPPLLAARDIERWGEPRHVLYLSTFSKLLGRPLHRAVGGFLPRFTQPGGSRHRQLCGL